MGAKVLFVDDEQAVLYGFERLLRREFEVETADSGELGLKIMAEFGPFAVVVSDMRMPGMDGAEFLGKARALAPGTVRILLTGETDLLAAIEAVNQGNIFRFLTKPCSKEILVAAIEAGAEQHNLLRAEKDLLERTLVGSIKVLTDFLSASHPEVFVRSTRIAHTVRHVAGKFSFEAPWRVEAAATLSQLGCVTLDTDVIQKVLTGAKLSLEEEARFRTHPEAAMRILSAIPRLEPVAWMIGQQLKREIPAHDRAVPAAAMKEVLLGAKILKLAVACEEMRLLNLSEEATIGRLRSRAEFERELIDALAGLKTTAARMEQRKVATLMLTTGMILEQEIRNQQGLILFVKGQTITPPILTRLLNFASAGSIGREVMAQVPVDFVG